ncbi:MAG: acetyl-CoA hydrolase/transferase family protein [Deltaproteobacteria bacterium]|nr:acetyl-CoA hydrolase/transferase family protein [Deltaproteobacteria bacterium]MBW2448377.1 acetyl-CoA hydrolase/transferase family protein [Deltaproteobacteria bacterium]
MKICTADEAAALLRPEDTLIVGFGPAQPTSFLEALGGRSDFRDLTVFGGLLLQLYPVFTKDGVHLLSGFFGPAERALRDAGHDIAFLPGDFRRFKLFAERMASRVMAIAATPPDEDGWLSLSICAGATVDEMLRCGRDPNRVLVIEACSNLPRTMGLPPEHRHAIHRDDVDVMIETDRQPMAIPDPEPSDVERAIAGHVGGFIPDGATLQTGIGGIPGAVAGLLADGPGGDYGIHTEMFTTGLMDLHKAGKVSNAHKGSHVGYSVTTFAMGTAELYEWLDGQEAVRFLPVEYVNTPMIIAANRNMRCINGALMVDLNGQVVADTIDGHQHSGIGGHEDFTSGASFEADDRSLICMPSTVTVGGEVRSRIRAAFVAGAVVTTPRHQLDIVVTEHGTAEVLGLTVRARAHALAEIAAPEFRTDLHEAADRIG